MQKSITAEELRKYTDKEILDMWWAGWTQKELVDLLRQSDKTLKIADARGRVERIIVPESFKLANKPVPKEWQ